MMITFERKELGTIPRSNSRWDTTIRDYGYDRISKLEKVRVIMKDTSYTFRKGSIVKFYVGEKQIQVEWDPKDLISSESTLVE